MLDDTQNLLEVEYEDEFELDTDSPFDEATEMELADEFLGLGDEAEFEYFIGKLFNKAVKGVKKFTRSRIGRTLGRALKSVAKKALPLAGGAIGTFFGGPLGGMIGSKLAGAAGGLLGLELEGLSPEDQEFEVARHFVRLAGTAAQHAAMAPPTAPARAVVKKAMTKSARKHAPGLLKRGGRSKDLHQGRWYRRGRKIIIVDV